ncbi:MAG: hypothetical protein LBS67_06750 [Clostridiales Family XIII bacterium]|nr:hypothetical protein [Clostridiales Family XIII bacterium]
MAGIGAAFCWGGRWREADGSVGSRGGEGSGVCANQGVDCGLPFVYGYDADAFIKALRAAGFKPRRRALAQ